MLPTLWAAPIQAKPSYFACEEDFGFIQDGNNLTLLSGDMPVERYASLLMKAEGAMQKPLETHTVLVDSDQAVASFAGSRPSSFAGSTESSFYPTHINISRKRPDRYFLLQISRKSLIFATRFIKLGRDGFIFRSRGKCRPIPLDPANKI
jgi:hypothetical protein